MERQEQIRILIQMLLEEMPEYLSQEFPRSPDGQRRLLRSLMNVRPPLPLKREFLLLQDSLLSAEREERGVVDASLLPAAGHPQIALWQGDITRLRCDAIVNAANSALLGCFHPCHGCIDNAIHSAAGLQLRDACSRLMRAQGSPEPNGRAKLTSGFQLPARYVLHTVGPIVQGRVTPQDRRELVSCYRACLGAGGGTRSEEYSILLYLYRGVPFPQPGGRPAGCGHRQRLSQNPIFHTKGDFQCIQGHRQRNLPPPAQTRSAG